MGKKIYLIYSDSIDDYSDIKGVIVGTKEDAKKWCDSFNSKCNHDWEKVDYEELKILTE